MSTWVPGLLGLRRHRHRNTAQQFQDASAIILLFGLLAPWVALIAMDLVENTLHAARYGRIFLASWDITLVFGWFPGMILGAIYVCLPVAWQRIAFAPVLGAALPVLLLGVLKLAFGSSIGGEVLGTSIACAVAALVCAGVARWRHWDRHSYAGKPQSQDIDTIDLGDWKV